MLLGRGRHDGPGLRRHEHLGRHTETEREGEQVTDGHGPCGGDGVVERTVGPTQDPGGGQLGQEAVDRLVEGEQALGGEGQGGRSRDRLGGGGDAEQRVTLRGRAADRQRPLGGDVDLVAPGHQRHQAGHEIVADVAGCHLVEARQPCVGQELNHLGPPVAKPDRAR
jgi:hypothetical protein